MLGVIRGCPEYRMAQVCDQSAGCPSGAPQMPRLSRLTELKVGQSGVICESTLDTNDAALLRAMGLCDQTMVRLCRVGEPCVVAVGGVRGGLNVDASACTCGGSCRIGLARPLADRIMVSVLA